MNPISRKILGLLAPMLLLFAGCAQENVTAPATTAQTAPDLHLAIAKGNKFSITLLESDEQKQKFPALQDQLNGKVIVDLPLYPGSTADDGPWKGSGGGVYNIYSKHSYKRYDAPLPLAQAKAWFQQEMTSEGYTTFGGGPGFTFWEYGKDPSFHLEVELALLDKGNGHTLVEYGVTFAPIPKRPSNTLLPDSVIKAELQVSVDQGKPQIKTVTIPDVLKKLVALYNQLPLSADDGNHSQPMMPNAVSTHLIFTTSDKKTVEISEQPHLLVQSGTYSYFDKDGKFAQLTKSLIDAQLKD